jgi:sugar diacid utilization regulator
VVLSGTRRLSGWTAPQSLLADRVYPKLRMVGPAALIGLSTDAPSTSHIPQALSEARIALDFASVADRVMPYSHIPLRSMLVRVAAEQVRSAPPSWVRTFLDADARARGSLTETLRAYADADMNVLKAAKALSIHPNTIYARMQKIENLTARNPLSYNALTELLLAVDCVVRG